MITPTGFLVLLQTTLTGKPTATWRVIMLKRTLPLVAVLFFACGDKADEIVIGCDTNPCEQHCDVEQVENYCADYDCGAHGQCAVGANGPICVCDQGFTLQDGVCKESLVDAPCKGIVCAGGGTCAVIEGKTAVCLCLAGYKSEGAKCVLEEVPPHPAQASPAVVMVLA